MPLHLSALKPLLQLHYFAYQQYQLSKSLVMQQVRIQLYSPLSHNRLWLAMSKKVRLNLTQEVLPLVHSVLQVTRRGSEQLLLADHFRQM
jgi:hypothetical protein